MALRRVVISVLLAAAAGAAGMAPGSAARAGTRPGIALAAPFAIAAASPAASTSKPCFAASFPDCTSSDPHVFFGIVNNGNTSSCTFSVTTDWGDKKKTTKVFNGGPDGKIAAIFDHLYAKRGSYVIVVTGSVTQGSCFAPGGTLQFTFGKVTSKLMLAALGDSYASGVGAGDYFAGSGDCHRSKKAWARLLISARVAMPERYFLACSGADSTTLKYQVSKLRSLVPAPSLVTLMIGGNDLRWFGTLLDCFDQNCIRDGRLAAATRRVDSAEPQLIKDYKSLPARRATILILGYPRLFEQSHFCGNRRLGLGFTVRELTGLNKLTDRFDAIIARAAAAVKLPYVDITGALDGHGVCAEHPWVHAFTKPAVESWHPNLAGQQAIAAVVKVYIDTRL